MQEHILKCPECKVYTMKKLCPDCGIAAISPRPAKFSPDDKYAGYRRKAKKELLVEKELI